MNVFYIRSVLPCFSKLFQRNTETNICLCKFQHIHNVVADSYYENKRKIQRVFVWHFETKHCILVIIKKKILKLAEVQRAEVTTRVGRTHSQRQLPTRVHGVKFTSLMFFCFLFYKLGIIYLYQMLLTQVSL